MPDLHYHYIITGAGCAGSSLLLRMMNDPFFDDKKILVIDQSEKNVNDHIWCFWEKKPGAFEPVVYHSWNRLDFFSDVYSASLDIIPYQYKMIRGIDLYSFVKNRATEHKNIEWRYEKINSIGNRNDIAYVSLESGTVTADYIFNSILFQQPQVTKGKYFLLQHFKGRLITTNTPSFDPASATFMDFRMDQKEGTSFFYVLPVSETTALVEYTLFTEKILPPEAYDKALDNYISDTLGVTAYSTDHEEFGIIPMTNISFPLHEGKIINIGTAGGQVKGSSGYAFQFIQKRAAAIIESLIKRGHPFVHKSFSDKKHKLYDSVLLNVLQNKKMNGDAIFAAIFQRNPANLVLKFLDNETSLAEDLQIMRSVSPGIFLPAAIHELFA